MIENVAVLADIHGNYWALQAVLKRIRAARIETIINLGDSLYGPLRPLDTARLIAQAGMISIAGNEDRLILEALAGPAHNPTIRQNLESLDEITLDWLKSLPATKVFRDFYLCHGTLANDCAYFCEAVTPKGVTLKSIEALEAITSVISQDIILCGHSHIPRVIALPNGKTIINPGSVGLPAYDDDVPCFHKMETGNPCAGFSVLTLRSGHVVSVAHHSVVYDTAAAVAAANRNHRPDWAKWLESGRA